MPGGQVTVSTSSGAGPRAVYEVLADISTHRTWAGEQQLSAFRVLELDDVPPGRADVGATWSSVGTLPMNRHGWHDRSHVTVADEPVRFEYITAARIPGIRQVAMAVGVRYMAWRGLRNIATMAEGYAAGTSDGV